MNSQNLEPISNYDLENEVENSNNSDINQKSTYSLRDYITEKLSDCSKQQENFREADNKNTQEKLRSFNLEFDNKIVRLEEEIAKKHIEIIKFFVPTIITTVGGILITIVGIQIFSQVQFSEFKAEMRKEVDEFTGKTPDKANLTLLGVNSKSLEGQTIEINKVFRIHRTSNNTVLSKPRYRYVFSIMVKNEGKGLVKSEATNSFQYTNVVEPESQTDDPDFNQMSYLPVEKEDPLTKIGFGKSIVIPITTTTIEKPIPGRKEKVKHKVVYGDQEITNTFYISFPKNLKFEDFDKP